MMSLRSAKYVNKPPEAHVKESKKKKHGKKHAEETSRSQWQELVRLLALASAGFFCMPLAMIFLVGLFDMSHRGFVDILCTSKAHHLDGPLPSSLFGVDVRRVVSFLAVPLFY